MVSLWLMGAFPAGVGPAVSFPSIGCAVIVPAPSCFVAEAGSMTVIMLPAGFCMAHGRCVRLVPYVIGPAVALAIAFLGRRSAGARSTPPASSVLPHSPGRPPICGSIWSRRSRERPSEPGCTTFSAVAN